MKKFLVSLLVLCMLFGCMAPALAAEKPVTLHWYYRGNGEQQDTEIVNARVNEMLKKVPGMEHVTLVLHPFTGADYATQVTLAITSSDPIDIINTVGLNQYQLVDDETVRPIDDLLKLVPELSEELPEGFFKYGQVDGKQYYVMHQQQAANGLNLSLPTKLIEAGYIDGNKMAAQFDFNNPEKLNIKEMLAYLEECLLAVREGTGDKTWYLPYPDWFVEGISNCSPLMGHFDPVSGYMVAGGFNVSESGVVYFEDTAPGAKYVFETAARWYTEGLTHPDPVFVKETGLVASNSKTVDIYNTDAPKTIIYNGNGTGNVEYMTELQNRDTLNQTTVWQLSTYYAPMTYAAGGDGITTSCKNPEEAMKFIALMNTKAGAEIYNTVVYGIEGEHWAWNEDGKFITTFGYDGPQGGTGYVYSAHKWIMGNTMNAYLNQACTEYTRTMIDEINYGEGTTYSALTGCKFQLEDISAEISQIAAIQAEYSDALRQGIKGTAGWEAYYNEYMKKLEIAGVDKVCEYIQKQVDAYLGK